MRSEDTGKIEEWRGTWTAEKRTDRRRGCHRRREKAQYKFGSVLKF
jgi:hypothetical protein